VGEQEQHTSFSSLLQTSATFTYLALVTEAAANATIGATTAITVLTAFTDFAPFTASAVFTFYITSATLAAFTIANCTGIIPSASNTFPARWNLCRYLPGGLSQYHVLPQLGLPLQTILICMNEEL
jgi:hypothetical protein